MIRVLTFTVVLLCAVLPGETAFAQEQTEPERLAEQLSESTDQKERALGKRWEGLIRRRQWTSASGKHKTFAKYVDHAEDLSWVKLLVLTKSGDEQTEKEVQIPLEKLDKKGRAFLDRIVLRRKEVEETLADSESVSDERRPGPEDDRTRLPPDAEREPREYPPEREPRRGEESQHEEESKPDLNKPVPPDSAPWRKSYQKFIGNLSATKSDPDGDENDLATWQLDWGELQAIRREWEAMTMRIQAAHGRLPRDEALKAAELAQQASPRVGEVVWEGVLKKKISREGSVEFDFPDPSKPFAVSFFLDEENPGDWQRFKPGDKIRFIGRIKSYGIGTPLIILHIRFPDELPSAQEPDRDERSRDWASDIEEASRERFRKRGP